MQREKLTMQKNYLLICEQIFKGEKRNKLTAESFHFSVIILCLINFFTYKVFPLVPHILVLYVLILAKYRYIVMILQIVQVIAFLLASEKAHFAVSKGAPNFLLIENIILKNKSNNRNNKTEKILGQFLKL